MSWDQYWFQDPLMAAQFREADRLRKQQQNEYLWLQGRYNHESLCVALHNALLKKGAKPAKYPEEPFPVYKGEPTEAERQAEILKQRQKMHDYLDSVVKAYKARRMGQELKQST